MKPRRLGILAEAASKLNWGSKNQPREQQPEQDRFFAATKPPGVAVPKEVLEMFRDLARDRHPDLAEE